MSADVDLLKQQMMELQSQLAFHEDAVRSLDEALAHQQQELLLLRRQLELLQQRQHDITSFNEAVSAGLPANDKPPHH